MAEESKKEVEKDQAKKKAATEKVKAAKADLELEIAKK